MIKPYSGWYSYNEINVYTDDISDNLINFTLKDILWHIVESDNQVIISRNGLGTLDAYIKEKKIIINGLYLIHSNTIRIPIQDDTYIIIHITDRYKIYSQDITKIVIRWIISSSHNYI